MAIEPSSDLSKGSCCDYNVAGMLWMLVDDSIILQCVAPAASQPRISVTYSSWAELELNYSQPRKRNHLMHADDG